MNTRERQEALAAAHTHGKKFFVTGRDHVTLNDMLIAAELNQWKAEATGKERDKKSRVEYHARHEAALPIVDRIKNELENDVGRLKSKELEVLLHKGCACVNDGERCEQTHPLPTICRGRSGGGGHRPGSVDGNR